MVDVIVYADAVGGGGVFVVTLVGIAILIADSVLIHLISCLFCTKKTPSTPLHALRIGYSY